MTHDSIFDTLSYDSTNEIVQQLKWDPLVSRSPAKLLSQVSESERRQWLMSHLAELERHISWVGSPIFSYAMGNAKDYRQIVADIAEQLDIKTSGFESVSEIEARLVQKLWADALAGLTPEQRADLLNKVQAVSGQFSQSAGKEFVGLAGLAAAQLSGFGVYVLGSTLLGAVNSALGLGLGFGAFTGLSSLISFVIGPIGWAAVGLVTIKKLGGPNYRKLLPVVISVAVERAKGTQVSPPKLVASTLELSPKVTAPSAVIDRTILPNVVVGAEESLFPKPASAPPAPVSLKATDPSTAPVKFPASWAPFRRKKHHAKMRQSDSSFAKRTPLSRAYTKAEKTLFSVRPENRELCRLAESYCEGTHFLDLSPENQAMVREFRDFEISRKTEAKSEGNEPQSNVAIRPEKTARQEKQHAGAGSKRDKKATKQAKLFMKTLPNLEFTDEAMIRLQMLDGRNEYMPVLEKIGIINIGKAPFRDSIHDTSPKIFEVKAAYDYRIYFYQNGSKIRIRLIGDKDTQTEDTKQLRLNPHGRMTLSGR